MSMVKPGAMPPFPKPPKDETPKQRKPMKKVGKRGLKRQAMNRKLDKLGIKECEIKLPGCWRIIQLYWAHSKKSRFLVTDEDWLEAARSCQHCHDVIEALSHEAMHRIVLAAIAARQNDTKPVSQLYPSL